MPREQWIQFKPKQTLTQNPNPYANRTAAHVAAIHPNTLTAQRLAASQIGVGALRPPRPPACQFNEDL